MNKPKKSRYMLVDGNALIHRGYHAIPGLATKSGEPTGAVYGFTNILLNAIKDIKPTHVVLSFDLAGATFRHKQYKDYKATRVKAAQELYDQIPRVKEVVTALNIPIFTKAGFEADDVLGTLATEICSQCKDDCEVFIVTGDLDTLQLVNDCVKVYTMRKGISDTVVYDARAVRERYGLNPDQMVEYRGLKGDPSDNIPGVAGIGEKTASEIIQQFGSLEKLYEAIKQQSTGNKIKPRILQLLIDQEEQARQSLMLSKIITNVPLDINIPPYDFSSAARQKVMKIFQDLEFKSLVNKLPDTTTPSVDAATPPQRGGDTPQLSEDDRGLPAIASATAGASPPIIEPAPALSRGGVPRDLSDEALAKSEAGGGGNFDKQDYQLIDTKEKVEALVKKLAKAKELVVDTETTGLDIFESRLLGISLSFKEGEAFYVPTEFISEELKDILASPDIKKIGQNIKFDQQILSTFNFQLSTLFFDTMIASYLLNPGNRQHSLDTLAFNELGYQMQPIEDLIGKGKSAVTMAEVPVEKVSWYSCEDADATLRLKELFEPRLKKEKLEKIFYDIEMPLVEVLSDMERNGIKLDAKLLNKLSGEAEITINDLESSIYKLTGQEFNINSPKQLKEVLFDKLKLEPIENRKTKTGLSTAAGELEKMLGQHPVIEKLLEYRELTKLQSTYLLTLPQLVSKVTGRLHTSYNQTIAATGRLSSVDPNLQNIPVRGDGLGAKVRQAFVAEKGYKLLSLDYSQIELRIVAHLAQDKKMMDIFKHEKDIHAQTAAEIFGVPQNEVTAEMRRDAKTINFGILYGVSSFGLSARIKEMSRNDAKQYIQKYFQTYPAVEKYIENIKLQVNEEGFVRNELGRMRKFPEIKSAQFFIRAAAERAAINFPIQSLAADVIKVAMININNKLKVESLKLKVKHPEIRMLLQVHDELVFEVAENKVEYFAKMIKPLMEEAIKLSVPVRVDAKAGDNWGEMEKLEI